MSRSFPETGGVEASPSRIPIHVNDVRREIPCSSTVQALMAELGLEDRKGVAVAVNGSVLPRSRWPQQDLAAEDRVLVIQATKGG